MNHVQIWTPNVCLPAALLPAYSTLQHSNLCPLPPSSEWRKSLGLNLRVAHGCVLSNPETAARVVDAFFRRAGSPPMGEEKS